MERSNSIPLPFLPVLTPDSFFISSYLTQFLGLLKQALDETIKPLS